MSLPNAEDLRGTPEKMLEMMLNDENIPQN